MKHVVVSGASKGIGRAVVLKFASQGHQVVVCSRNGEHLRELASHYPDKIRWYMADMSQREDIEGFYEFIQDELGYVDVLVNNAGLFLPGSFLGEEEGMMEQMMDMNFYSAYRLTRLVLPGMMERQTGHIFNMCSVASLKAYPNGSAYCITKFALYGMTQVLREEMKPHGIKVTALLPGATFTPSWEGVDLPQERFMNAEDVAAMMYAASELSPGAVVEEILLRPQLGDI